MKEEYVVNDFALCYDLLFFHFSPDSDQENANCLCAKKIHLLPNDSVHIIWVYPSTLHHLNHHEGSNLEPDSLPEGTTT